MIRWLWNNMMKWGWDFNRNLRDQDCYPVAVETIGSGRIDVDGLNFNVMPAQGGTIVQLRQYDRKTDRHNNSTHIIAEGQDIAEAVGKIVAMELWKA